jgi:hypothetical protein
MLNGSYRMKKDVERKVEEAVSNLDHHVMMMDLQPIVPLSVLVS